MFGGGGGGARVQVSVPGGLAQEVAEEKHRKQEELRTQLAVHPPVIPHSVPITSAVVDHSMIPPRPRHLPHDTTYKQSEKQTDKQEESSAAAATTVEELSELHWVVDHMPTSTSISTSPATTASSTSGFSSIPIGGGDKTQQTPMGRMLPPSSRPQRLSQVPARAPPTIHQSVTTGTSQSSHLGRSEQVMSSFLFYRKQCFFSLS